MPVRSPLPVRAVFFDLADTLAGYMPSQEELLVEACAEVGLTISAQDARRGFLAAGEYLRRAQARLPIDRRNPLQRTSLFAAYDRRALAAAGVAVDARTAHWIFQRLLQLGTDRKSRLTLYGDTLAALDTLKTRGFALGIISNWGPDLWDVCRYLGLTPWVDDVMGPSEAGVEKPHPTIFRNALRKLEVPAAASVYVGDNPSIDIAGARRAGLQPILLDRQDVLPGFTAGHRATSLPEVVELLLGGGQAPALR